MRYHPLLLITGLLILLLSQGCQSTPDPRPFSMAKIDVADEQVTSAPWQVSTDVFKGANVQFVVVATWCIHSKELLDAFGAHPELRQGVQAALIFEDEVPNFLRAVDKEPAK